MLLRRGRRGRRRSGRALSRSARVVVVGAGIGGLTAAHHLLGLAAARSRELEVVVLDGRPRAGGVLGTDLHEGCRLERGPDSLVLHKPAGVELCRELGLAGQLVDLPPSRVDVLRDGRLLRVPEGFAMIAPTRRLALLASPLLGWRGKLCALAEPLLPAAPRLDGDESVASFVRRRFGGDLLERLVEPLVGALFLGDVERLSIAATLPRFRDLERDAGSVTAGLRGRSRGRRDRATPPGGTATLSGGLGALADVLAERLPDGALRLGSAAEAIESDADGLVARLTDGTRLRARAAILAVPAPAAARLVEGHDAALADRLRAIEFTSCATLHLAWPVRSLARPPSGHGFFVPRTGPGPLVAAGFVHLKFPDRIAGGLAVVRLFLGGAGRSDGAAALPDDELVESARGVLAPLLGVREAPAWTHLVRHVGSVPRLEAGHLARVEAVRARLVEHPQLEVAGGPVGAWGVPDSIAAGRRAAERLLDRLGGLHSVA